MDYSPPTLPEVYREHGRQVWRVLRRLGVPEAEANDATQDVFLVVHRKLATFEGRSRMSTWLFQICLRVASDRRRSVHQQRVTLGAPLEHVAAEHPDAESQLRQRQEVAILEAILDQMDFDQRAVFTMFELEELSGDEIAEALQIPLGTVRSRLRLAREAFRAAVARLEARERFSPIQTGARP